MQLAFARTIQTNHVRGDRGQITGFSAASRRRFLHKVASIDRRVVEAGQAIFITLTYPGKADLVPKDPAVWRRHLEAWRKRYERTWGQFGTYWKLEFQRRGAAHWHLLAVVPPEVVKRLAEFRLWTSRTWNEIAGANDSDHLKAGTNVSKVRSWSAVMHYAGKYLGKSVPQPVDTNTGEICSVGRFWGVWNEKQIPVQWAGMELSFEEAVQLRRVVRRYVGRRPTSKLLRLCCFMDADVLERAVAWAVDRVAEGPGPATRIRESRGGEDWISAN